MKYYSISVDSENTSRAHVNHPPEHLLKKNLYESYSKNTIDSIIHEAGTGKKDFLNEGTLNIKGFVVSNRVRDIFLEHHLFEVQFVKITSLSEYYFMFFNSDLTTKLNYELSNFQLIKRTPLKEVILDDALQQNRAVILDVYKNQAARSIFKFLEPKNGYHFNDDFNIKEYDAFRIGHFDKSFYISEKLMNRLIENNITGCVYVLKPIIQTT